LTPELEKKRENLKTLKAIIRGEDMAIAIIGSEKELRT
jgi:hypothetical protein